ncbi:MAG: asparaginase [Candidatus Aenigmarchaeota archaeon]|nr:asparaginase [Candidatus Aenigmarchaeota archaeon]
MGKKKILLIGTGGTVTAKMVNGSWKPGCFSEADLLEFAPEIRDLAEVTTLDLFHTDSSNIQPQEWLEMAKIIRKNCGKYDGIVITHGTDTMHYTASALSFLVQGLKIPVVLTGSQVPPHKTGSDARRNLMDAIRVASETDICEMVIVFNSKILRGNRAKKFREVEFEAFESIGMLPLGVIEHDIRLTGEHLRKGEETKFFGKLEEKVCIIKLTPGMDPKIIQSYVDLGYKGLVIEGFGAGNVPIEKNSLVEEIGSAVKKGVPVVVSTQCAIGSSWMYLYETGRKALEAGAIPGHDMISETAMTKLMWIIGNFGNDPKVVKEIFLKDVAGEVSDAKTPKEKRIWEYSL